VELIFIAEVLKEYELYCYRIAFYLLEREEPAVLATKQALIELAQNECFFIENNVERWKMAKKATVKHSLALGVIGAAHLE
jgi:hypothetical protein